VSAVAILRGWSRQAADAVAPVLRVRVDRCYHFRGFRYGGFGQHPYEDYVVGLARGRPTSELRHEFARRMLACRPINLGQALQVDIPDWPLWLFPWMRRAGHVGGTVDDPAANPDIVTHHCAAGILASHINREFGWLEGAWHGLRQQGYQPRRFGYLRCLELEAPMGSSYIMLDGNHRLCVLHAMGIEEIEVRVPPLRKVRRAAAAQWPSVRDGSMALEHALAVFDRYFAMANPPLTALNPARLIVDEPPQWPMEGDAA
jgi:hypothetical protein